MKPRPGVSAAVLEQWQVHRVGEGAANAEPHAHEVWGLLHALHSEDQAISIDPDLLTKPLIPFLVAGQLPGDVRPRGAEDLVCGVTTVGSPTIRSSHRYAGVGCGHLWLEADVTVPVSNRSSVRPAR